MDGVVLRDIHQPPAPPWWPPAPGWWLLAALVLLTLGLWAWWYWRRRRHRRAVAALFDDTLAQAPTPAAQVAAMSELLRRAARRVDPAADRLRGEDWLRFLDAGVEPPRFAGEPGRLLLEGGFRRDVDVAAAARLRELVRARYLDWMGAR